jgi:branched-chain amino acid transport system substrate-binding protein
MKLAAGSLAIAALVLAGCSGAPRTAAAQASSDDPGIIETAGPTPDKSEIKIGIGTAMTGPPSSAYVGVAPAAEAWATWVNRTQGGINGHPVTIVAKDTKSEGATTRAVGTEMVADPAVLAMIIADSQAEASMAPVLGPANMPVVGGSTAISSVQGVQPNYFTLGPMVAYYLPGVMQTAKAVDAKEFAAFVCAESPACQEVSDVYTKASSSIGVDYTGTYAVAASSPDFTAPCLSAIEKKTDFMTLVLGPATAVRVVNDCQAQGYSGTFGAASQAVVAPLFEKIPGLKLAGAINGFPWWADAEPVQQFRNVMKTYLPGTGYADGVWRNPSATNVWASLELFRKTMGSMSDAPTRDEVTAAYHRLNGETLGGLLSQPVSFPAGSPAPHVKCYWAYKLENGQFSTVAPSGAPGNRVSGDLASTCRD